MMRRARDQVKRDEKRLPASLRPPSSPLKKRKKKQRGEIEYTFYFYERESLRFFECNRWSVI